MTDKQWEDLLKIICPLESFVVNLVDKAGLGKRYLKTTIELEVGNEDSKEKVAKYKAQLRDTILMLLTSQTFKEISTIEDGSKEFGSFTSNIEFRDVNFAYQGRTKTLKNISVSIEKGKTVAIVGRSGSGKTTIVSLILRLFQPDVGDVLIDGVDIKEYRLASWLDRIGYVDQDTFIFNDSVKNNITLRSEKYTDEDVKRAAGYADAHDFITDLPDGYDTHVGDKGVRLSGGQKQRIAVARAMIRQPDILIFDEATNALDSVSEAAVQKAIDEISRDHTVIIIAHRLSTIVNADRIIVMARSKVAEVGTHEELMSKKGDYWRLYEGQTR